MAASDTEEPEEMDLPPLDSDEDEGDRAADPDELIQDFDDDGDPLDDATAADLDVGGELEAPRGDQDASGDEGDASLDVGALDDGLVGGDDEPGDDRIEGLDDDHDDLDEVPDDEDDGGRDGTDEPIEDEVDADDLPELDADEDGDFEGEDLLTATLEDEEPAALVPPWDPARWVPREGAGAALPCRALAVAQGRVVAAGDIVLIVDEGAHAARRASFASSGGVSVALADGAVVIGTTRGGIAWCAPGAATAAPLAGWRTRATSIELGATTGRLWILADEALWCRALEGDESAQGLVVVRDGRVLAIATDGGVLVALTSGRPSAGPGAGGGGFAIEKLRGDDEGWQRTPLEGEALRVAASEGVRMAVAGGGRAVALADRAALCVSRDGGESFRTVRLPGIVAVAFAGDEPDAALLALVSRETDDIARLVEVPAIGEASRLAEIGPIDGLGDAAVAWDPTRELCWIACRAGLLAFGRARKH